MNCNHYIPLIGLFIACSAGPLYAAPPAANDEGVTVTPVQAVLNTQAETAAQRDARMKWWREAKFGMFIHWGIYSVLAGSYQDKTSYGEWVMQQARIPVDEYRRFGQKFNPVKYDPAEWVRIAQGAGMRYMVITSKHHDGFALFPSTVSNWNVAEATPYKKDLLGPLVGAAHDAGLKIGFYYSQSQDWNNRGGAKKGYADGEGWDPAHRGSYDNYINDIAVPQVRELLTRYPIDILWWDTPMFMTPERVEPFLALKKLRPGLISNNRLGGGPSDMATPEQYVPITGRKGDWETCMTMNGHWGYNAYDTNWKSTTDLIHTLAETCSRGGNLLLNVGPTAEGKIPTESVERLHEIGRWIQINGDSIYGTTAGPFTYLAWGCATRKGDTLYLHVFNWPANGRLVVPLNNKVKSAYLLAAPKQKLKVTSTHGKLVVELPVTPPDAFDSVVAMQIQDEPIVEPLPSASATVKASSTLNGTDASYVNDGTEDKLWRAPAEIKVAFLDIELKQATAIGGFGIAEPDVWPRMNQVYTLEYLDATGWHKVAEGRTIGHGVKRPIPVITAKKFRLTMECNAGSPGVAEFQLYGI